jgi:hypothetical protein
MHCRSLRLSALSSAFGLTVLALAGGGPARAQDDESNSIWNLEKRVWNGVVHGLGLRSPDDPVIEYRERSPLVVPSTRDLPPPQAKAAPKDAAWPKDPDVARTRARSKRTATNVDASRTLDNASRPMTPDELNVPGATASTTSGPPPTGPDGRAYNPNELGYFGGLFNLRAFGFGGYADEVATFTNEPPRAVLTAPPTGYQTPSPAQPYGTTRRVEHSVPKQFDPSGER